MAPPGVERCRVYKTRPGPVIPNSNVEVVKGAVNSFHAVATFPRLVVASAPAPKLQRRWA